MARKTIDDGTLRHQLAQLVATAAIEQSGRWQYRFGCVFLLDSHGACVARLYDDGSLALGEPPAEIDELGKVTKIHE